MSFVAGREEDTSICTICYMTVRPHPRQPLSAAESLHECFGPSLPLPDHDVFMIQTESQRQAASKVGSLLELLKLASANVQTAKRSSPSAYEECLADVREIIRQIRSVNAMRVWSETRLALNAH